MRYIYFPCILIFYIFILLLFFAFGFVSWKEYKEYVVERREKQEAAEYYYKELCMDSKKKEEMRISDECHNRWHILNDSPEEFAIKEVIESWVCGKNGCDSHNKWLTYPLETVFIIFAILGLIVFYCGLQITKMGFNEDMKHSLPFLQSTNIKKEV